jgi:hypothetical protein
VVTPLRTDSVRLKIADSLEAQGVPLVELHLVEDQDQLRNPLPLRGDLREGSFSSQETGFTATVGCTKNPVSAAIEG